jgi:dGTPase
MDWKTLLNKERPRKSTSQGDHRAEFERDFDRSVFSTPVKRLQDKAQVFPLEAHDAVRTRLTHSLEVSSVARGLAIAVAKWLLKEKKIESGMERSIEAIAATCGLIHDLGNPPFGHAGEQAIQEWFKERLKGSSIWQNHKKKEQLKQDFLNFEGNAQSLRLLTKLQILVDHNGLNLTFGTLSASLKYIASSHESDPEHENKAFKKPGHFASESEIVKDIQKKTGTGKARNPLTFLVEAADDIVYSVTDIEDGVKKGILTWNWLKKQMEELENSENCSILEKMDKILTAEEDESQDKPPDDVYASAFRTAAIGALVPSVVKAFKTNYDKIMAGEYTKELITDCDTYSFIDLCKKIGKEEIYCTSPTLKLEIMGRKVIGDLMTVFWEGAKNLPLKKAPDAKKFSGKVGALLSENYRRVFQHYALDNKSNLPEQYHRFQLVTDYVCGMTDTFAKRLHADLSNGF